MPNIPEHARKIRDTIRAAHRATTPKELRRALAVHHAALVDAVREHGAGIGLDAGFIADAVAPKDPPPNPEG